jgi:uncharacterized protein
VRAGRWSLAALTLMLTLAPLGVGTAANGAEVPVPASPARWATDTAGFLKPQTVADLDARLHAYQSQTGHQVLVYVAPTTGTTPTEDWTVRAFARWKVGRKGLDDGLVLFVFPTDRKVRIEVGYGLEQTVPDATAARIIRDTITPKIRAGRPDDALDAGVDALLATIGGEANGNGGKAGSASGVASARRATPPPYEPPPDRDPGETWGELFGILLGVLISLGVIVTIMKLPASKGTYISSRGSGGGGWGIVGDILGGVVSVGFSGGGFSGGGGMSGGGGATGSW